MKKKQQDGNIQTKRRSENILINKIMNENGNRTTDSEEFQIIIRTYF